MGSRFLLAAWLLASAAPVLAQESTALPEPSNLALFGIGVAGVLIGRHASRRKRD